MLSPLFHTIKSGKIEKSISLTMNEINVDERDEKGKTLLHWAAQCTYIYQKGDAKLCETLVEMLLKRKVNPDGQDNEGNTPLHCLLGSVRDATSDFLNDESSAIAHILIKVVDPCVKNNEGNIPLHLAIKNNHIALAKKLIERNIGLTIYNNEGECPLSFMETYKRKEIESFTQNYRNTYIEGRSRYFKEKMSFTLPHILSYLAPLNKNKETNIPNGQGYISLHDAVEKREINGIIDLIRMNNNPNDKDSNGNTPLHLALFLQTEKIAKLLAMVTNPYLQNIAGKNLLEYAFEKEMYDVVKILLTRSETLELKTIGEKINELIRKTNNQDLFTFAWAREEEAFLDFCKKIECEIKEIIENYINLQIINHSHPCSLSFARKRKHDQSMLHAPVAKRDKNEDNYGSLSGLEVIQETEGYYMQYLKERNQEHKLYTRKHI